MLAQQLYCIETLARVDALCLDKTGTITTGRMEVEGTALPVEGRAARISLPGGVALVDFASPTSRAPRRQMRTRRLQGASSTTMTRLCDRRTATLCASCRSRPTKKWSGRRLRRRRVYVMGAGAVRAWSRCVRAGGEPRGELAARTLPPWLCVERLSMVSQKTAIVGRAQPLGFVTIRDQIRATASRDHRLLQRAGRRAQRHLRGRPAHRLGHRAQVVGIPGASAYVDATTLDDDRPSSTPPSIATTCSAA